MAFLFSFSNERVFKPAADDESSTSKELTIEDNSGKCFGNMDGEHADEVLGQELENAIKNLTSVLQVADYEYLLDGYGKKIDQVLKDVLRCLDEEQLTVAQLSPVKRKKGFEANIDTPQGALGDVTDIKGSGSGLLSLLFNAVQKYRPILTLFASITLFQLAVICTFGFNVQ